MMRVSDEDREINMQEDEVVTRHLEREEFEARNQVRIGKSAGGEMHLSAVVFCSDCRMWVELGTRDCPHAISMWREYQKKSHEAIERNAELILQTRDERESAEPWAYAIETPGGDMYDGEYAVFSDSHSAQDQVDMLNDDLTEEEEQYKLVPLYKRERRYSSGEVTSTASVSVGTDSGVSEAPRMEDTRESIPQVPEDSK